MEKKINDRLISQNKAPTSLIKNLSFDGNIFDSFDVRQMAPSAQTIEPVVTANAVLALRLRLLNKFIKEYDKNYNQEINVHKSL